MDDGDIFIRENMAGCDRRIIEANVEMDGDDDEHSYGIREILFPV